MILSRIKRKICVVSNGFLSKFYQSQKEKMESFLKDFGFWVRRIKKSRKFTDYDDVVGFAIFQWNEKAIYFLLEVNFSKKINSAIFGAIKEV